MCKIIVVQGKYDYTLKFAETRYMWVFMLKLEFVFILSTFYGFKFQGKY
jgi:hypothetical protein